MLKNWMNIINGLCHRTSVAFVYARDFRLFSLAKPFLFL